MKPSKIRGNSNTAVCIIAVCISWCALVSTASAQPVLNFKRVVNNWPTIELYFTVACNGHPTYIYNKEKFRVRENGVDIPDFELWCPDSVIRCALSLSLVFDASASMAGAPRTAAIRAGRDMVNLMDGVNDEATVIWGRTDPHVAQPMTVFHDVLYQAIDQVPATASSSIWDAVYEGLTVLIRDGVNPCRGLLVFTDGVDNSSIHTQDDVIALANRNRIRIFTLGFGRSIDASALQRVADLTGARYYDRPNAAQMSAIYQELSAIILQGLPECIITYEASCTDGSFRSVDLSLLDFCSGSDSRTKSYRAPRMKDQLELATTPARLNRSGQVLLRRRWAGYFANESTDSVHFRCLYDTGQVTVDSVMLPSYSPFSGMQLHWSRDESGVTGSLRGHGTFPQKPGQPLIALAYSPHIALSDTTRIPLTCIFASMAPCAMRDTLTTTLELLPPSPHLTATLSFPDSLAWNPSLRMYTPEPFSISLRVTNIGELPATPIRQWVACNDKVVGLIGSGPSADTTSIEPGATRTYTWQFRTTHIRGVDTTGICAGVRSSNTAVVEACGTLKLTRLGLSAAIGPVVSQNGRTMVGLRAVCNGDALRSLAGVGVSLAIDGRQISIDSITSPRTSGDPALFFVHAAEPCPDGGKHTYSLTVHGACDTTITVHTQASSSAVPIPVDVAGPRRLCPGDSAVLDVGPGYATYSWSTGDTTQRIVVRQGGKYIVRVRVYAGCERYGTVTITDVKKPVIWPQDTLLLCAGHRTILYSGIEEGDILWSTGERTREISVAASGKYAVTAVEPGGCTYTSDTVFVLVVPSLQPVLSARGPVAFCRGGSVVLETQTGFAGYRWNKGGSNDNQLWVTESGEYFVTVYDASDSCSGTSNSITVTVYDAPPTPVITRSGDVLHTAAGYRLQWYYGNTAIAGAVDTVYTAVRTGSYKVRITDARGCSTESENFYVGTLAAGTVVAAPSASVSIHPNPACDRLYLTVRDVRGRVTFHLYDALGRLAATHELDVLDAPASATLDVHALPRGYYLLRVMHTNGLEWRSVAIF
ncbi:MAG: VWA domain-containing protein [Ignavibacteriae bacterium]|nr:VWA domain-containing protein [Ignavibacteriota bacterium]